MQGKITLTIEEEHDRKSTSVVTYDTSTLAGFLTVDGALISILLFLTDHFYCKGN